MKRNGILSIVFASCAVMFLLLSSIAGWILILLAIGYSIAAIVFGKKAETKLEKIGKRIGIITLIICPIWLVVYTVVSFIITSLLIVFGVLYTVISIFLSIVSGIGAFLLSIAEVIPVLSGSILSIVGMLSQLISNISVYISAFNDLLQLLLVLFENIGFLYNFILELITKVEEILAMLGA